VPPSALQACPFQVASAACSITADLLDEAAEAFNQLVTTLGFVVVWVGSEFAAPALATVP